MFLVLLFSIPVGKSKILVWFVKVSLFCERFFLFVICFCCLLWFEKRCMFEECAISIVFEREELLSSSFY